MRAQSTRLFVLAVSTALFGAALAYRQTFNPWVTNLLAASAGIALVVLCLRGRLRTLLQLQGAPVETGLLLGFGTLGLTHLGYAGAVAVVPSLRSVVERLYADIHGPMPAAITAVIIVVVVASEELLWRGLAFELFRSRRWAVAGSTLLYAAPQLIGGSWLLLCAALAMGALWAALRSASGGLVAPFVSHAIWSVGLFSVIPLQSAAGH